MAGRKTLAVRILGYLAAGDEGQDRGRAVLLRCHGRSPRCCQSLSFLPFLMLSEFAGRNTCHVSLGKNKHKNNELRIFHGSCWSRRIVCVAVMMLAGSQEDRDANDC